MKYIYLFVFIYYGGCVFSQEMPMLFSVSQEDYELLENPISINNGEIWQPADDYALFFNFEFEIYDQTYTALVVNAGLGLTFPGEVAKNLRLWGHEWGGDPFLTDRGVEQSESPIDYEIVGDTGSRILKIQWQNAGIIPYQTEDDPDDFVNFQVWLLEGSNRIEVHYGQSQTSDLSFAYNEGPGVRFTNIMVDSTICVYGFADLPSYRWIAEGPYLGCMVDGVASNGIVYNFYPSTVVSIDEITDKKDRGFTVTYRKSLKEFKIEIDEFDRSEKYKLSVYDDLGIKLGDFILDQKETYINNSLYKKGMYVFVLRKNAQIATQKLIVH